MPRTSPVLILPPASEASASTPCYAPLPETNTRLAKDLALWDYKGALTYVQDIPMEDRKALLEHKLFKKGPHPLEGA